MVHPSRLFTRSQTHSGAGIGAGVQCGHDLSGLSTADGLSTAPRLVPLRHYVCIPFRYSSAPTGIFRARMFLESSTSTCHQIQGRNRLQTRVSQLPWFSCSVRLSCDAGQGQGQGQGRRPVLSAWQIAKEFTSVQGRSPHAAACRRYGLIYAGTAGDAC